MPLAEICTSCAMGDCQDCEGTKPTPCGCARLTYHTEEKLRMHAGCVGPEPYCALIEHVRNARRAHASN